MVDTSQRLTTAEIATRYDRALSTIQTEWVRDPRWPEPVGKRGRWYEYDADAVDRVVREHFLTARPDVEPDRLYTLREAADLFGVTYGALRSHKSRNKALWTPDDTAAGTDRWYGRTLARIQAGRNRHG